MKHSILLTAIFALPAAAGMILFAGCDTDETDTVDTIDTTTDTSPGTTTGTTPRPTPTPSGGAPSGASGSTDPMPSGTGTTGGMDTGTATELSAAVKQQVTTISGQLKQAAETAIGEAETAGDTTNTALFTRVNELVDGVQRAVDENKLPEAAGYMQQLQGIKAQLPPNMQEMLTQLAAAIPGASGMIDGARGLLGGN